MADNQDQAQDVPRTRLWVKVLLAVSLALNLAVLGLVAGAVLRQDVDRRAGPSPAERSAVRDLGLGVFLDAFAREHRREMARALRERSGSMMVNREKLAQELEAMLTALRAEPYDPDSLLEILEAQRSRMTDRILTGREVVLEQIAKMTPQERQAFADRLESSLHRALEDARRRPPGNGN